MHPREVLMSADPVITDAQLASGLKEVGVVRQILEALRPVPPALRYRTLRGVAVLHGFDFGPDGLLIYRPTTETGESNGIRTQA